MARYAKGPRAGGWADDDWDNGKPLTPDLTVDSHQPIKTGLIWHTGEPVMRLPYPMGFGRDDEW